MENKKAYPTLDNNDHAGQIKMFDDGMDLRDYFAAKAMQGELSSQHFETGEVWANEVELAERAYLIADAMMKARKP